MDATHSELNLLCQLASGGEGRKLNHVIIFVLLCTGRPGCASIGAFAGLPVALHVNSCHFCCSQTVRGALSNVIAKDV